MHHVKSILNFIDIILGTFWSVTLIEVIPLLSSGTTVVFTQIDSLIKILFSFGGLIYLAFRINHYHRNSKLDRELKAIELIYKQEELSKRDLKFLKKFYEEFLKDK